MAQSLVRCYEEAFGLVQRVVRHTSERDDSAYQFGDYEQPGFFLLFLVDESNFDRPGPARSASSFPISTEHIGARCGPAR